MECEKGPLCTVPSLVEDFKNLGIKLGDTLLVHSSLSRLGWVNGGPVTVVSALVQALGDTGTLVVPTHSGENSDPAQWSSPPVPQDWWQAIRDTMPAFDTRKTMTFRMGKIPETVRNWPGALRSGHPQSSFTAIGPNAATITGGHALDSQLGEQSPLARLEDVGAKVLLLGVGYGKCTTFHLAEYRYAKRLKQNSFAVMVNGKREWMTVQDSPLDGEDFEKLGNEFEETGSVVIGNVGAAQCRIFAVADAVAFAVKWMKENRPTVSGQGSEATINP